MTEQVKDLVCGMALDPSTATIWSQYGGQRYYFCSAACKDRFEQNPADFVSNL
ncbi:MAG TPA: YHS domain-containing protein [Dehalococcoidia bacterium]|jgi:Cu+-exporting ATPase